MTDALEVVKQHIDAFHTGDLERIVADFAEDVVLQTPTEVVRGRDGLRTWFEGILHVIGTETVIDTLTCVDDVALVVWHVETEELSLPFVVDTYIVRDGKIAAATAAYYTAT